MKRHIQKCLNIQENPPEVLALLNKLHDGMKERFKDVETNELTTQATFLDPRFKKYGFSSERTYENTFKTIKAKITSFAINTNVTHTGPCLETVSNAFESTKNTKKK